MKIYIDITNLLKYDFISGIQRVEREILCRFLKQQNADTIELLAYYPNKQVFRIVNKKVFYSVFFENAKKGMDLLTEREIKPSEIPAGSVFFDIDNVWNSWLKRSVFYPRLREQRVNIVTFIYDTIPITHPQFFYVNTLMGFIHFIGAALENSDRIITYSQANVDSINEFSRRLGTGKKDIRIIPLGSDFIKPVSDGEVECQISERIRTVCQSRYLLMLGTMEPRKNHTLVLDALDNGLVDLDVNVIFAGRWGWNFNALRGRIEKHPLYNDKLFVFQGPDDDTVNYLYENAYAVVFPSLAEGYGLPIIEALQHNTPVIASDIPVFHEVGGNYIDYFDPGNPADFTRCVADILTDPEKYSAKRELIRNFKLTKWDDAAKKIYEEVTSVAKD